MESLTYGEPEPVCRVKLLREKTRQIGKMALTYRMYEVAVGEHSAYAVGAARKGGEGEENTPLFLYDHCSARAEAFFFYLLEAGVFPCTLSDVLEDVCGHFSPVSMGKSQDFSLQIPENMV